MDLFEKAICMRIKELRLKLNFSSYGLFAKFLGVGSSVLGNIESLNSGASKKIIFEILKKVENINSNWLLTGKGSMFHEEPVLISEGNCQVLKVEDEIAAGPTGEHLPYPIEFLSIGTGVIKDVSKVYCFQVNGDSMEPEIKDRDLVVVKRNCTWEQSENKICAVSVDQVLMLKRVLHDHKNKLMMLISLNNIFEPIVVLPKYNNIELVGILQTVIRNVK